MELLTHAAKTCLGSTTMVTATTIAQQGIAHGELQLGAQQRTTAIIALAYNHINNAGVQAGLSLDTITGQVV